MIITKIITICRLRLHC